MGLCEVRPQPDGFAELRGDLAAIGAAAAQQAAERVVRLCSPLLNTRVGGAVSTNGFCRERLAEAGDGAVPVGPGHRGGGEVQPRFELPSALSGSPARR